MGHIREWVENRVGVPEPWVTRRLGLQCAEYPSLVDGAQRTETGNQMGLRWLAREMAA